MTIYLDGRKISTQIKENIASEVSYLRDRLNITPQLTVIQVGDHPASNSYVQSKKRTCEAMGMASNVIKLPETTTESELMSEIERLNQDSGVSAILVQLPLPQSFDVERVMELIDPRKDVDGFHPYNVGLLPTRGVTHLAPCTPLGIISLLRAYNLSLEGKHVVILGRSEIVGKPMMQLCLNENATVTVCHSKTHNLIDHTARADVLIVAIGKPHFVTPDMVKEGAIVIDVGINRLDNGKLVGDVAFDDVAPKTSYITPVPGGVGPMTIASLLNNTIKCAKLNSASCQTTLSKR